MELKKVLTISISFFWAISFGAFASENAFETIEQNGEKYILISTISEVSACEEFIKNSQILQTQRQALETLNETLSPEEKVAQASDLKIREETLTKNNESMMKAYGFNVFRDYIQQIVSTKIFVKLTDEEYKKAKEDTFAEFVIKGDDKYLFFAEIQTIEANEEFRRRVQTMQNMRENLVEINNKIQSMPNGKEKNKLQKLFEFEEKKLKEENDLMIKEYGFSLTRNYLVQVEQLKLFMKVNKEEYLKAEAQARLLSANEEQTASVPSTIAQNPVPAIGETSNNDEIAARAIELYNAGDYETAFPMLKKSAERGNAEAMFYFGRSYHLGQGIAKDYRVAVEWYKKAAERGNASAMNGLGFCYLNGTGVRKNSKTAVEWFRKAIAGGNALAMNNLGTCFANGEGVERDLRIAKRWYQKAAENDCPLAMSNLGACYLDGLGVEENPHLAVEWFQKAAELGQAAAMHNLGVCYAEGKGVPCDKLAAREWYKKALENGYEESGKELAKLEKELEIDGNAQVVVQNSNFVPEKENSVPATVAQKSVPANAVADKNNPDINIPATGTPNENLVVFIIANEDYRHQKTVKFAKNDGEKFKEYMVKTFGVLPENIKEYPNATGSDMDEAFGLIPDHAEYYNVVVYYAGHAVVNKGKTYLLPVDIRSNNAKNVEKFGIDLANFYEKIEKSKAKQVVVFLDACHAGKEGRGAVLDEEPEPPKSRGNMIVFSAALGEASPVEDYKHGLFTYCLLKKFQESRGNVSYEELANYLQREIPRQSLKLNNRKQEPKISHDEKFDMKQKFAAGGE